MKETNVNSILMQEQMTELRYHSGKIRGIVNGIDIDNWNPATDKLLAANYDAETAIANKKINKKTLQESLGLDVDDHKIVIGLIYGKAYAIRAYVFFKKNETCL